MNEALYFVDGVGDPVTFDLADGNKVKVVLGLFETKSLHLNRLSCVKVCRYVAIRIYSSESPRKSHMELVYEAVEGNQFLLSSSRDLWEWLVQHSASRKRFDHESVDDFISMFEAAMDSFGSIDGGLIKIFTHDREPELLHHDNPLMDWVFGSHTEIYFEP